jgi:hypothetical protein
LPIKLADTEFGASNIWYQAGQPQAYHYTGLGNLIVAMSIFYELGFDLASLDLSGITNNEISNENKSRVLSLFLTDNVGPE